MPPQKAPSPTHRDGDGAQPNVVGAGGRDERVDSEARSGTQDRTIAVIANWPKNQRESFQVSLDIYQGKPLIAIRVWYTANDGVERPSRSGLNVGIKHLPKISEAVAAALVEARARGLVDGGDEVVGRAGDEVGR